MHCKSNTTVVVIYFGLTFPSPSWIPKITESFFAWGMGNLEISSHDATSKR